jgi:hypothetical protein
MKKLNFYALADSGDESHATSNVVYYEIVSQNARVIEACNFLTHAWNEMELM